MSKSVIEKDDVLEHEPIVGSTGEVWVTNTWPVHNPGDILIFNPERENKTGPLVRSVDMYGHAVGICELLPQRR